MSKEYPISEEIKEMFDEMASLEECRDLAIEKVFGWKRAAYFGKRSKTMWRKAWDAVMELYPEFKYKEMEYVHILGAITLKEEE